MDSIWSMRSHSASRLPQRLVPLPCLVAARSSRRRRRETPHVTLDRVRELAAGRGSSSSTTQAAHTALADRSRFSSMVSGLCGSDRPDAAAADDHRRTSTARAKLDRDRSTCAACGAGCRATGCGAVLLPGWTRADRRDAGGALPSTRRHLPFDVVVCANCEPRASEQQLRLPRCGTRLPRSAAPRTATTVTILFCDVTGSTALGESNDPEAFRSLLAHYFERMNGIVKRTAASSESSSATPHGRVQDAGAPGRRAACVPGRLFECRTSTSSACSTGSGSTRRSHDGIQGSLRDPGRIAVNVAARLEQQRGRRS